MPALRSLYPLLFYSLPTSASATSRNESLHSHAHHPVEPHVPTHDPHFVFYLFVIFGLVCLAGIFAGLTLGLLSLDQTRLLVLSETGADEREKEQASKVLDLFERCGRHLILVALLLANTFVNTSLPIFLDSIVGGGWLAILISTALIVIFGEILPQALCSRWGLPIGAFSAPFVRALLLLLYPLAKPIASLLDWLLGHSENSPYSKPQLKRFLSCGVNREGAQAEVAIIESVLDLGDKTVESIMTRLEDVFSLPADRIMDEGLVQEIMASGYSRVPIHEPGTPRVFRGLLLVKRLLAYDPDDRKTAGSLVIAYLPECDPSLSCLEALSYFQSGRSHMLLVSKHPGKAGSGIGVVTLEDVIEEMLGAEIIDETDVYVDSSSKIRVVRPAAATQDRYRPLTSSRLEEGSGVGSLSKVFEGIVRAKEASTARQSNGVILPLPSASASLLSLAADIGPRPVTPLATTESSSHHGKTNGARKAAEGRLVDLGEEEGLHSEA